MFAFKAINSYLFHRVISPSALIESIHVGRFPYDIRHDCRERAVEGFELVTCIRAHRCAQCNMARGAVDEGYMSLAMDFPTPLPCTRIQLQSRAALEEYNSTSFAAYYTM